MIDQSLRRKPERNALNNRVTVPELRRIGNSGAHVMALNLESRMGRARWRATLYDA